MGSYASALSLAFGQELLHCPHRLFSGLSLVRVMATANLVHRDSSSPIKNAFVYASDTALISVPASSLAQLVHLSN